MKTGLFTAGLLIVFAVSPAFCQAPQRVKIGFEFGAGGKLYPAGDYEMMFHGSSAKSSVSLRNAKTQIGLNIVTRLARRSDTPNKVALVFDRVGDQQFLSEIWVPDHDGFLVRSTKETHEHRVITDK